MTILILGANGFIGSAVLARLARAGCNVTGLGRDIGHAQNRFPTARWIKADLASLTEPERWMPLLEGIEAVVNCAGALQDGLRDNLAATQQDAMLALYDACKAAGVGQVVQISARLDLAADLPFLVTKASADAALKRSGLPHVILRPALVLGRNAHGGSALLRALASMPLTMPLVYADQAVHTVALDDVVEAVAAALSGRLAPGTDTELAGDALDLAALVRLHRAWLGLAPARILPLAPAIGAAISRLADLSGLLGWRSPLRTTAMRVMSAGIEAAEPMVAVPLRSTRDTLAAYPAGVQDLWFARLYLMKPVMVVALALFWFLSGTIALIDIAPASAHFLPFMPTAAADAVTIITSLLDIGLGLGVLYRPLSRLALIGQIALACLYLIGGSILETSLWLDPLGPYVKVLPAIILSLATLAILDER